MFNFCKKNCNKIYYSKIYKLREMLREIFNFNNEDLNYINQKRLWIIFALSFIISAVSQAGYLGDAFINSRSAQQAMEVKQFAEEAVDYTNELIRFHILANSDSEGDQALKNAVRDEILKEVSPILAKSNSLEESREILTSLRPELEAIARDVIVKWGKDYEVRTDYGKFNFPTKSYGSIIFPGGEYEAVRILIGEAEGSNWWCVLFPPLCFVDIEHSTAVSLEMTDANQATLGLEVKKTQKEKPRVRFWLLEKIFAIFSNTHNSI